MVEGDPTLGMVEPGTVWAGRPTGGSATPGVVVPPAPGTVAPGIVGPVVPAPGWMVPGRTEPPPNDPCTVILPGLRAKADTASTAPVAMTRTDFFDIAFIMDKRQAGACARSTGSRARGVVGRIQSRPRLRRGYAAGISASGVRLAISRRRNAAPDGFRSPCSHFRTVTGGTFNRRPKTA